MQMQMLFCEDAMSERPWMPLYTGDFVIDTMHLGPTERGIYISLLVYAWNNDGKIPPDDYKLCNICGCDRRLWRQYKETALQFFDVVDASSAQHKRVVTELRRSDEIINKRKAAALQVHENKRAHVVHMQTHSQSHKKEDIERASSLRVAARSEAQKGSRLSENWTPSPDNLAFAESEGLSAADLPHRPHPPLRRKRDRAVLGGANGGGLMKVTLTALAARHDES
jgi:uncharacterized protein YdaU (DUF1376 family)